MCSHKLALLSPSHFLYQSSKRWRLVFLSTLILISITTTIQAQEVTSLAPIKVNQTALPVTIGVPLSETANITDASRLALLDPSGNSVAMQTRILARWRGASTDSRYAIKWALLDFQPQSIGTYTLSTSGTAVTPVSTVSTIDLGNSLRISSSRVEVEFSKQGVSLITSFKSDGAEQLKAPVSFEGAFPRGAVVAFVNSSDTLTVSETGMLKVGDTVRFEHVSSLLWAANAGDSMIKSINATMLGNRRYLLEPGSARQEEVLASSADNGKLMLTAPLKFAHPSGSVIRDLTAEQETAVIKSINGQVVTFTAPLTQQHVISDAFTVANTAPASSLATVERTYIEEQGALRTVVLQEGHFTSTAFQGSIVDPSLKFTIRYYIYAGQPFIRVRFRMLNEGPFGFGAWRRQQGVFSQHLLLRRLSALIPTASAGTGNVQVVERDDAYSRVKSRWTGPTVTAGAMELSVPEFAENYPKGLLGDASGLRFDVMPDPGYNYQFDGARAKTTDFYLGRQTASAMVLTNKLQAFVDPSYLARTGAIRPMFVEKRNWSQAFSNDAELADAATRAERWISVGYDVTTSDENWRVPASSIFEYRLRDEGGAANLGWRNFGDLAWGDGYCNLHYDLSFILLREFARTGDSRAFQAGSESVRYLSDWGQYHSDDWWDSEYNMRGLSFYEKGDHGGDRMPQPTHSWSEGLWLYWSLTGDESVHASALEAAEASARIVNYQYLNDTAIAGNESRWVGWPALSLIAAYRYTGDARFLDQSRKAVYMLVQAEEEAGSKGYYIPPGNDSTKPWMWAGYSALGAIEYYRETGDSRTADYLVRQAEWLLGQRGESAALAGGNNVNGQYQPLGVAYFWYAGKVSETPSVELGMTTLPTLVAAARITGRSDFRNAARQLFRDVAFYRDFGDGPLDPSSRAPINFRSFFFAGSSPKTYGHTGLSLSEFLPDLVGSIVLPVRNDASGTSSRLLNDTSARTATVGQTLVVNLNQVDAQGKPLQLSAANVPANASFNAATGSFSFTPVASQAGNVFQVIFTGKNAQVSLTAKIDIIVQADVTGPRVLLTAPTTSDRLVIGRTVKFAWVTASDASISKYQIRLSTDGGASYPTVIADLPGNSRNYEWTVPSSLANQRLAQVRVMILATDSQNRVGIDFTRQDLSIAGTLAVVNSASYRTSAAPGALCSAFGTKMVATGFTTETASLYIIHGTHAEIVDSSGRSQQLPLYYAGNLDGYDQVNFYLPENVALGQATITVTSGLGEVSQTTITIDPVTPAIFTANASGTGSAAIVTTSDGANFNFGFARQDADRDVYVSLFGTGWRFAGQTTEAIKSGGALLNSYEAAASSVTVELNGSLVEVLYAGPQIQYIGLDQINFRLPRNLKPGSYSLVVRTGTQTSNVVQLDVK